MTSTTPLDPTLIADQSAGSPDAPLVAAVLSGLDDLWSCGRDWSAWDYGTMGETDFSRADADPEIVSNFTDGPGRLKDLLIGARREGAEDVLRVAWDRAVAAYDAADVTHSCDADEGGCNLCILVDFAGHLGHPEWAAEQRDRGLDDDA